MSHRPYKSIGGVLDLGEDAGRRSSMGPSRSIATPSQPLTTSGSSTMSTSSSSPPTPVDDVAAKVFSTSYCPSLARYHSQTLTMRAVNNEGSLDVLREEAGEMVWETRYCILNEGVLRVYATEQDGTGKKERRLQGEEAMGSLWGGRGERAVEQEEEEREGEGGLLTVIPLDMVASVRSAAYSGRAAFQITTPERTWVFSAASMHTMQEWLFAFHRSLAVIVARLVEEEKRKQQQQQQQLFRARRGGGPGGGRDRGRTPLVLGRAHHECDQERGRGHHGHGCCTQEHGHGNSGQHGGAAAATVGGGWARAWSVPVRYPEVPAGVGRRGRGGGREARLGRADRDGGGCFILVGGRAEGPGGYPEVGARGREGVPEA
ncbi:protein phosphatase 1e, partial [Nannochloropsis gaditana]